MRIGIMCHASFGGSGRIGVELALALARRGHRVHLFTRTTPLGGVWEPIPNVELHTLKPDGADESHPSTLHTDWPDRDVQDYLSLILRVIDTEGLDVLHYHYAVPFAFVAQRLQTLLGDAMPRLVGTLHGTDVTAFGKAPGIGPRLTRVLQSSDFLTAVSTRHAELAATVFDLPRRPQVIPNFVDLSRFWPISDESLHGQVRLRPRLVHVSNFRPIKDPQSMARIFLDIRARMEAELWLIGDGEALPTVRALFEQSAFADDVCYLGLQRDVATYLRDTDLLLMTSLYESFCLVASLPWRPWPVACQCWRPKSAVCRKSSCMAKPACSSRWVSMQWQRTWPWSCCRIRLVTVPCVRRPSGMRGNLMLTISFRPMRTSISIRPRPWPSMALNAAGWRSLSARAPGRGKLLRPMARRLGRVRHRRPESSSQTRRPELPGHVGTRGGSGWFPHRHD